MEMMIYLGGNYINTVCGCEVIGEAWVAIQKAAELLEVNCALVSAETGEVIALWEP